MGFSSDVAGVLTSINEDLRDGELGTMLASCLLQEVITQRDKDSITEFNDLVQKLLDRCFIQPNNVGPLTTLLKQAHRTDLADRLHISNGHIRNSDRRNSNLGQSPSMLIAELKDFLLKAYHLVYNFYPTHQCETTTDVDEIFHQVQLSMKKGGTSGEGLRQPLEHYTKLFTSEGKNRVLLKGNVACGKTTLLRKIVKDWASGKLSRFKILFVLSVAALTPGCTLGEAVVNSSLLPKDCIITADQIDKVARLVKDEVAILLDGFEEYQGNSKEVCPREVHPREHLDSSKPLLIRDIILYQQLREAFVIVATRPLGAQNFRSNFEESCRAYQQVEVTGFSEDTIDVFVEQFFEKKEKKSSESLLTYLGNNDLKDVVCAPSLLRMLCQYWDINQDTRNPPEMINSLFYNMLCGLHNHNKRRESICSDVSAQDSVKGQCPFKDMMLLLGEVGFDVLKKQCEVFPLSQLEKGSNNPDNTELIQNCFEQGLLKFEDVFKHRSKRRSATIVDERIESLGSLGSMYGSFGDASCSEEDEVRGVAHPHGTASSEGKLVSFQSNHIHWYCVGLHLRELAKKNFSSFEKKMKKLMQPHKGMFEKKFVLLFCFGCNEDDDQNLNIRIGQSILKLLLKEFQKMLEEVHRQEEDSTEMKVFGITSQFTKLCLHCNYEAQVGPALNETLSECFIDEKICLVGVSEYTTRALAYFLKHSKTTCKVSTLKILSLGNEVSIASLKEFRKHVPGAENFFRYLMNKYADEDDDELTSLKEQLERNVGGMSYSKDLCKVKKVALLHFIHVIRKWHPHINVLLPTVEALRYQADTLTELTLMVPNIKNNVWDQVIKCLKKANFKSMEKLDLSFCGLTNRQLNALASLFVSSKNKITFPNLKHLVLSGNHCNKKIIENFMYLTKLEHLAIQECKLTKEDFQMLTLALQDIPNLKELDIRRNDFFDENVQGFLNVIRNWNVEVLKLCLNNVRECIPKLVNAIKKKKTLRVLHLNHCPEPITLFGCCKDVPVELPHLTDFRLSGELPQADPEATSQPYQLQKIKLLHSTMNTFTAGLRSMKELQTFSFLYCMIDSENFSSLYNACQYLQTSHKLKLMRYSYAALDQKDGRLLRIVSRDRREQRLLQLW
ncbi:NACHT, LRR and PYD domains-containing protein 10 [Holothuria leucospilota]|uniref:NACHT, LRR and PYD domains-containing protein 10 n=1 Tax=Holothuria leucospilota TaxID=206669 RepID=A0A9Q0YI32_HOLLE|nr:NACHT, LRR and PYD domains-containing protein 10 [Holothuria leucospilota]